MWFANNRGTWYSQGHVKYDATKDNDYWMFTWADMGLYDDPANIDAIRSLTNNDKIFYVGYSQGTIQMHYGLAHNQDFLAERLLKVVSLAPCFICSPYILHLISFKRKNGDEKMFSHD